MTDHILSSFDPLGTESNKEFDRELISLMSSLMVATEVDISLAKKTVEVKIGGEIVIKRASRQDDKY
jgi:hypothetical protein